MKVLQIKDGRETVGFAPFLSTTRGRVLRWTKIELIGAGASDRCALMAKEGRSDVLNEMFSYLEHNDDWDVLELRDMLDDGPTASSVRGHFRSGEYASAMCPYLGLEGNYMDYLHRLSGKMRGNLVKGRRKLEEQGCVLRELQTPNEVAEGLRTLKMLSDSRWDSENVL